MDKIKKDIIDALKKETKQKEIILEVPPDPEMGDYAFPCFSLAKEYKKNPVDIAQDIAKNINLDKIINKIECKGPYLNFFVNKGILVQDILKKVDENYGSSNLGKGRHALIEHTSINPNASPHVGRARNALIGDAIVRILKFQNYKTEVHYFVNDVGKQIAMLVLGAENKSSVTFKDLLKIYVNINKKIKEKPELEKDVFELLNKLEKGDKATKDKFNKIVRTCIDGQTEIFDELGIKYDSFDYESMYLWSKDIQKILEKLQKTKKLFKDEEGRQVLNQEDYDLAMKSPVLVLTRADGTSLYPLRDILYSIEKSKIAKDENIILLGEDQKLYFQQLAATLDMLKVKAPRPVHYSFVLLQEGKMSTRKGTVVLLEDFMKEALEKAKKEIKERHGKVKAENAKKIAYGAIKYAILRVSPDKNVIFNWEQALNFEGDSGPYLQYAYARICSILSKYGKKVGKADIKLLDADEEIALIKKIGDFPKVIEDSTKMLKPNLIANYLFELSKVFSNFYNNCHILNAEEELKKARLLLVLSVKQVLYNGLGLLGIETLKKM